MYTRIARFEGHTNDEIDQMIEGIKAETGPPEGVTATRFMVLVDRENGRSLGIGFFETEEDLRTSDEALNAMSGPPSDSGSRRTSVEMYEVAVDLATP
jgi:ethanolamine utilization protein EutQ (cupin superfamily)